VACQSRRSNLSARFRFDHSRRSESVGRPWGASVSIAAGFATHALPGDMPLPVNVRDLQGQTLYTVRRDSSGSVRKS
jgi:hypothetical protein